MRTLQSCEKEPIHLSGGIQPIGVLLILDGVDYRVIQASANSAVLLDMVPAALLGLQLAAIIAPAIAAAVLAWHGQSRALYLPPIRFLLGHGAASTPVDLVAHRIDQTVQVEILPVPTAAEATTPNLFHDLLQLNERISEAGSMAQLLAQAAGEVALVTGAQRVMVYEFDPDFHGTVTFETLAPGCEESYMGLKFPASDIPPQARALYLKNRIRVIADTQYRAVPLEPVLHPVTGQPVDLTYALLRSVSPVHLEYLGNMGVRGSMSISLVVNGALWGMIICHHDLPLLVSPDHRNYCEVLGQIVALHVGQLLQVEASRLDLAAQQTLFNIFPSGAVRQRFAQTLMQQERSLLLLFAADGMILQRDGRSVQSGIALDDDAIRSMAALAALGAIASSDMQSQVFAGYDEIIRSTPDSAGAVERTTRLKQGIDFDFLKEDTPDLILQSRHGITRVRDIVQNLKDFSHVGTEDQWVHGDLVRAMDNTLNIVLPELRGKAEVVRLYDSLPSVWCVPSQINQVFLNLLRNAGQAIPGSGTVTVRMAVIGDEVAIDISDTGVGIAPYILGRIFEPFFTTRDVGQGTGLGLSVAYGIIEHYRGQLSVQSAPNQGTTLRILLPIKGPA